MENETLTLIKTRRSIRSYKEDLVPAEMLNAILEAGTYAPTGRQELMRPLAADVSLLLLSQLQIQNTENELLN